MASARSLEPNRAPAPNAIAPPIPVLTELAVVASEFAPTRESDATQCGIAADRQDPTNRPAPSTSSAVLNSSQSGPVSAISSATRPTNTQRIRLAQTST